MPENAVLSHDLLEGIFARCALVSDVELFEDFPSHSEVAATRTHRWTRGDWQLLPWIFGRAGHDIPAVGRWKLLDNLRRSLVAPTCLAVLVASWSVPRAPWPAWFVVTVLTLGLPAMLSVLDGLLPPRAGGSLRHHFRMVLDDLRAACVYLLVSLTFLAQQSWLVLDAIVRTLWRLCYPSLHCATFQASVRDSSLGSMQRWARARAPRLRASLQPIRSQDWNGVRGRAPC